MNKAVTLSASSVVAIVCLIFFAIMVLRDSEND